ncbi:MAG: hypothetical protein EP343_14835 [Deltaproteobacteria bacterium]|nr:MAG: hypothetical protein EP343_14835 [Deltaproteobacteria bacterium]
MYKIMSWFLLFFGVVSVSACSSSSSNNNNVPTESSYLVVEDQRSTGSTLLIKHLKVEQKGWLFLSAPSPKTPNDIYGSFPLEPGQKSDWTVTLAQPIPKTSVVQIVALVDDGDGKLDVSKDRVMVNDKGQSLKVSVRVTIGGPDGNRVVIEDQVLVEGNTKQITIKEFSLVQSGQLFVAKDANGKPGTILARSNRSAGSTTNMTLTLSEALTENQTLHATLYEGGEWSPTKPILNDKDGKPIQFTFQVTLQSATQGAELVMENQELTEKFDTISVKAAALPPTYLKNGMLVFHIFDNGKLGDKVAEVKLFPKRNVEDLRVSIDRLIVGVQHFQVKMVDENNESFTDSEGKVIQTIFEVRGDTSLAQLVVNSQVLPDTLNSVEVEQIMIPDRYEKGAWLAIYEDDQGNPGKLVQKKQFKKGEYKSEPITFLSKVTQQQTFHALLREGRKGSGSWDANSAVISYADGKPISMTFQVNHPDLHPRLEIEDQTLNDYKTLTVKSTFVPGYTFGAWLGIYSDNAGKPGDLLAKRSLTRGSKSNITLTLSPVQQGEKTLHAVLYEGTKWDPDNAPVMKDAEGDEVRLTFQIGAKSLNYLVTKPYVTNFPRVVKIEKAFSYEKMAWVVLARDDNGKPGTIIAKRRIAKRFSGRVVLHSIYNHFEKEEKLGPYLQGKGFREYIRGEENVHVLMYADDPQDNKFTYKPGGTEDQPLLDANGKPVTARMKITVKASVDNSQVDSPTYFSPCPLSQYINNPTKLPTDCRCHRNIVSLDFPRCSPVIASFLELSYGKGPRFSTLNLLGGGPYAGFGEKASNEIITVVSWKDHKTKRPENGITVNVGAVMAIHADTGDRRLIGGRYNDLKKGAYDIGEGPVLSYPFRILKGSDGFYYIASYAYTKPENGLTPTVDIIQMDPKTGNRKYVWRSNHLGYNLDKKPNPYGHCPRGRDEKYGYRSVQVSRRSFAMDPDGNFYLSYADNGGSSVGAGIGIIKVSSDGKQCSFVTRTNTGAKNHLYKGKNIGSGPEPQAGPYKGMMYRNGFLYATISLSYELYKIDVKTGDREIIHKRGVSGNAFGGTGDHIKWDSHRDIMWMQGFAFATMLFELDTRKATPLFCRQNNRNYKGVNCLWYFAWPTWGHPTGKGFWFHPNDKDFVFMATSGAIIKVHLPSGTDAAHSY